MRFQHLLAAAATISAAGAAHADFTGWTAKVRQVTGGFLVNVFATTNASTDAIVQVRSDGTGYVRTSAQGGFRQGPSAQSVFAPAGSQNWTTLDSFLTVGGGFNTFNGAWTGNAGTGGDAAWTATYVDTDTGEAATVNSFNTPSHASGFANPNLNSVPDGAGWLLSGTSSPARSLLSLGQRDFSSSPAAASASFGMMVAQFYVAHLTPPGAAIPRTIEWRMSATLRRADGTLSTGTEAIVIMGPTCPRRLLSGELAPFSFANPRTWTASNIGSTSGDARIRVTARGNLGTSTRFLTLKADGTTLATGIFGAGSGSGNCLTGGSSVDLTIPAAQLAALAADGSIVFRVEPSLNATSEGCPAATLALELEYVPAYSDCNGNDYQDWCEIAQNPAQRDCNGNGVLDSCEIASGAPDVNANGILDACEADCNGNGLPDPWETSQGLAPDCNLNAKPDSCDIASGASTDVDGNGVPDSCQPDCNTNGIPDAWETSQGTAPDCNANGRPDSCDIGDNGLLDCNLDGIIDACQGGTPGGADCNVNGVLDVCEIANGAEDKNGNGKLDSCELAYGDLNLDGNVDGLDLGGLLALWGAQNPPYGDLNRDGWVDGIDLGLMLAHWGPVP